MTSPGDLLLAKLIGTYRREHQRYASARADLGMLSALLGLTILILPVLYLVISSPRAGWSVVIFIFAFSVLGLVSMGRKVWKARKALVRLKTELEDVGMRIACNHSDPYCPALEIIQESACTGNHVLLPIYLGTEFQPKIRGIDFAQYNKLFRI